ncbi:MAG: hypothetical protein LUG85_03680 [Clostridiales bacterium]|nr:hypothetical protein [Clostridiales bacterium]
MEQQEEKEVFNKVVEYIKTLPDGTQLSMRDALEHFGIDSLELPSALNYCVLDEICAAVERNTDIILDFSAHDDLVEGLPLAMDFYVYHKRLQKAQIISDLLCYGPCPEPDDPVEQRLTISSTGRIWFTERTFGPLGDTRYPIGRRIQMSIGKERAAAILSKLADYSESAMMFMDYWTDIGSWHLMLTGTDGSKKEMSCSMNGDVFVGDVYLNDFIRARIPIEGLAVFGGGNNNEEDDDEDSDMEC